MSQFVSAWHILSIVSKKVIIIKLITQVLRPMRDLMGINKINFKTKLINP